MVSVLQGRSARRPHRDHKMRRLVPVLPYPVAGYEGEWLTAYRERWDLLREDGHPEPTDHPAT